MIIRVQLLIFCAIYVLSKNDNIESDNLCNVINYPHVAILNHANQNMFLPFACYHQNLLCRSYFYW